MTKPTVTETPITRNGDREESARTYWTAETVRAELDALLQHDGRTPLRDRYHASALELLARCLYLNLLTASERAICGAVLGLTR